MNSKFNEAIESLQKLQHITTSPIMHKIHLQALQHSELFYLPDAVNLVEGKLYDDDLKKTFKLPFGCISVLSGCSIYEDKIEKYKTHKISIAFDVNCEQNFRFGWINPTINSSRNMDGYFLMSIIKAPIEEVPNNILWSINKIGIKNLWWPTGDLIFCEYLKEIDGKKLHILKPPAGEGKLHDKYNTDDVLREYLDDSAAIENLCLLLSLHNVKEKVIKAPEKLNKKRIKNGNAPLLDYKVLVVNGDVWDSEPNNMNNNGYRSHMRRGHIRRLDENRKVWVSSCFVRGRKDGFVDKEYHLSNRNYIN